MKISTKTVRVGAGLGFYGDSWQPVRASIERGGVQYIASDHLSELTLAILQKDRQKDPKAGYARDGVPMLTDLWPLAAKHDVKFVLNAGGLNPQGAREAIARTFCEKGWKAKIATVTGDSVLERIDELRAAGEALVHMDTGGDIASVRERMLFASAYLGAQPIAEALARGADIVLTGRVADAALTLGPLAHEFGWQWDDWDRMAAGLTLGHLLECSGQGSGGNFGSSGEWAKVPDYAHLGYPIAEVSEDGTALFTKPPGTGGRVSFDTIRQQLLYEVHNPHAYYSPDVVLDMGTLNFEDEGHDRVRISGASGAARPKTLKIVAGYQDGWMGTGMIGFAWPEAYAKCEKSAQIIAALVQERGWAVEDTNVEYIGYNSLLGANADPTYRDQLNECFLRMTIRTKDRKVADAFGRLFPWLGLSGPPYVGSMKGVQPAKELLGIWPALVNREMIESRIEISLEEIK
ncbi:MAG TPA: acyclic terpene utilization AtuA family protein [Burkholderiales bacterium]|nr:acyclic terpene utilization AtuA family protein [Burkholderiales bacterium]